ncbi:hypothetical protein EJ377_14380 [Chryseobacterium arthrosphaerae]|uniref:Uncharacterized protein n=1 Tax=Chryseobacterium arthrosphaerae TaxID=651561 RepID=A0A432DRZ8_9FLAO|nr:hypothetical protein EJ377_14380 [Chryseobacterium arthrosphaerae]
MQLNALGCSSLQLRINKINSRETILEILEATRTSRIRSLEIVIPEFLFDTSFCQYLEDIENRISIFVVHSVSDENKVKEEYGKSKFYEQKDAIYYKVINSSTKDVKNKENLIVNVDFFVKLNNLMLG